jgi:hypothetical protein
LEVGGRLNSLNRTMAQLASWSQADVHEVYYDNLPRSLYNREQLLHMPETLGLALWERLQEALVTFGSAGDVAEPDPMHHAPIA